nr:hypothetical protein [uncultured Methanospirillum sp.]
MAEEKKKKGFFAAIKESFTKTSGCCGNGETCGCTPQAESEDSKKTANTQSKQ